MLPITIPKAFLIDLVFMASLHLLHSKSKSNLKVQFVAVHSGPENLKESWPEKNTVQMELWNNLQQ